MAKKQNVTTLLPSGMTRGNPRFAVIVAQQDWREKVMPDQSVRHPECGRNELFLMNVTPAEFAWFHSGNVPMVDFKGVRLGKVAYLTGSITKKVDTKLNYHPMFGRLKRGARLRRKAEKVEKKVEKQTLKKLKKKVKGKGKDGKTKSTALS